MKENIIKKVLLNNTKINSFKFDYLDSVGTSNEGLNTMANLGATTTSRAVDRKKKQVADEHNKYCEIVNGPTRVPYIYCRSIETNLLRKKRDLKNAQKRSKELMGPKPGLFLRVQFEKQKTQIV